MKQEHFLDQAIDPHAQFAQVTAEQYDAYLSNDYQQNFEQRKKEWMKHYRAMEKEFIEHIFTQTERDIDRKDMGIAIVGPGNSPVGREFQDISVDTVLSEVRHLVVADFSSGVVRRAMENIHDNVSDLRRMYGMQFDLTDGYSTAYDRMIEERMHKVHTERDFYEMAEEFDNMPLADLYEMLNTTLNRIEQENADAGKFPLPDVLIGGKINETRSLSLTSEGEPVDIHTWYLPMVLAGMGAAAEHRIWENFSIVTCDEERGAEPLSNPETIENRITAMQRIYNLISRFNTIVATKAVRDILQDNPTSHVLAISDTETVMKDKKLGSFPRLNVNTMRNDLLNNKYGDDSAPIAMLTKPGGPWKWADEEDHGHIVNVFEFYRRGTQSSEDDSAIIYGPTDDITMKPVDEDNEFHSQAETTTTATVTLDQSDEENDEDNQSES